MSRDPKPPTDDGLTGPQRRSVLRVGATSICLALAVPLYYALVALVPPVADLVPPMAVHAALGIALFVVFPAMFGYARYLSRRPGGRSDRAVPEYGVDDRWERQNL